MLHFLIPKFILEADRLHRRALQTDFGALSGLSGKPADALHFLLISLCLKRSRAEYCHSPGAVASVRVQCTDESAAQPQPLYPRKAGRAPK